MMRKRGLDSDRLLELAIKKGLAGGLDVGTEAGDTSNRVWVHRKFPRVKLAAGLYPAEAEYEDLSSRLDFLVEDIESYPVNAIGEIGIDYHWNYGTPEKQRDLMIRQIEIANRYGLPIIVHNREADTQVAEILQQHPPLAGGIMHCFSSGPEAARTFVDAGMHISFAGNITYKNSHPIRSAARTVPLDRVLLETDSPYLSPQRVRRYPNHPGHIGYVYNEIAKLHGVSMEELVETIGNNFSTLFPSKSSSGQALRDEGAVS